MRLARICLLAQLLEALLHVALALDELLPLGGAELGHAGRHRQRCRRAEGRGRGKTE